jgi:nitrogen regulatory protein PII
MDRMVMLIMERFGKTTEVMDAWQEAGVSGITVWESRGIGRMHEDAGLFDDLPIIPSLSTLLQAREEEHRTIFTLVDGDEMVDKLIDVTEEITGGLDGPNKGILLVLPVLRTVGVLPNSAQVKSDG